MDEIIEILTEFYLEARKNQFKPNGFKQFKIANLDLHANLNYDLSMISRDYAK